MCCFFHQSTATSYVSSRNFSLATFGWGRSSAYLNQCECTVIFYMTNSSPVSQYLLFIVKTVCVYRVLIKLCFFSIHCFIAVRDLQSSQHNSSVQSLLLARILGKNTIFNEQPVYNKLFIDYVVHWYQNLAIKKCMNCTSFKSRVFFYQIRHLFTNSLTDSMDMTYMQGVH